MLLAGVTWKWCRGATKCVACVWLIGSALLRLLMNVEWFLGATECNCLTLPSLKSKLGRESEVAGTAVDRIWVWQKWWIIICKWDEPKITIMIN